MTDNCWCSVDAYLNVLSNGHLLPSINIFIRIWIYWLSFWLNETQTCGKAECSNILALFTLILLNLYILPKDSLHPLYICPSNNIYKLQLTICLLDISNWHSWSSYVMKLVKHWFIVSYFVFIPLFLLISNPLTITNSFSAWLLDFRIGRINPETCRAALSSRCSRLAGSLMPSSCSESDSMSAAQSSLLSFGSS